MTFIRAVTTCPTFPSRKNAALNCSPSFGNCLFQPSHVILRGGWLKQLNDRALRFGNGYETRDNSFCTQFPQQRHQAVCVENKLWQGVGDLCIVPARPRGFKVGHDQIVTLKFHRKNAQSQSTIFHFRASRLIRLARRNLPSSISKNSQRNLPRRTSSLAELFIKPSSGSMRP